MTPSPEEPVAVKVLWRERAQGGGIRGYQEVLGMGENVSPTVNQNRKCTGQSGQSLSVRRVGKQFLKDPGTKPRKPQPEGRHHPHSLFSSTSSSDFDTTSSPATGSGPGTQLDLFWKEQRTPSAGQSGLLFPCPVSPGTTCQGWRGTSASRSASLGPSAAVQ